MSDSDLSARVRALEAEVNRLQTRLNYDDLTGAFTRQYLFDRFSTELRDGSYLIFVDLDDFKSVNDHYGHAAGDTLLRLIGQAMIRVVADTGYVVRIAGDEFVVVLDPIEDAQLHVAEASLRHAVRSCVLMVDGLAVSRTASLGYIQITSGMDVTEATAQADIALAHAKAAGKNRAARMDPIAAAGRPRAPSVDMLRRALQKKEIGYYVQPVLCCRDRKVAGYEALLRWSMPSGEIIGPAQFLDTMTRAYDDDTPPPLDQARATSRWAVHDRGGFIAFNLSEAFVRRLNREGLDWVDELVGDVPHERVVFELLETMVTHPLEEVSKAVDALRRRGIRVALDDFGVGFSNLARLETLDVDIIKIDKRFVQAAVQGARGYDVFHAMIEMSKKLNAQVVVEGIESAQHAELAEASGAEMMQGYYLGRPKPIDAY